MPRRRCSIPACAVGLSLGVLLLACGCTRFEADWCYRHFQIGQLPRDYRNVLPADASRRTPLGLAYLRTGKGRRDAIVVLLADDRRVAGKIHASVSTPQRLPGLTSRTGGGYALEGELDPKLCGLAGAGPLDALRAVVADMSDQHSGRLARRAYALVGGGLIRLMQAKADLADVGAPQETAQRWLADVPAGGTARIEADENGIFHFGYQR